MPDHDPHAVEIRPAATVMLVRERPRLEVLMLRRNTRSVFVSGMWVFPGGAVDDEDDDPWLHERLRGVDLDAVRSSLGRHDAPAYWVATLRETFEEAGVLAAVDADGAPVAVDRLEDGEMRRWRDALNDGTATMRELLEATDLLLDASRFAYVARFITPLGPPRRYDTRFFLARTPDGQVASVDDDEAVGHAWIEPGDALARHASGEMAMMTPTLACLRRLAAYRSVDEALDAARSPWVDQRIRIDADAEGADRVVFSDDPKYGAASESEFGWLGF